MDLTFRTEMGRFNYRVGAVIIHNGRHLLMRNTEAPYSYTVGGRVHFNETTEEAVIREVKEETGVELSVDRMLFFQEQMFEEEVTGEHVHELGVYFLMKDSVELEHLVCESRTERGMKEELFWASPDELDDCHIVPESVAVRLRGLPEQTEHIIEITSR